MTALNISRDYMGGRRRQSVAECFFLAIITIGATISAFILRPSEMYLWLKLGHIFFMISWFAGLFYLPRLFVNLAQVDAAKTPDEYARLLGMAQRLYKFMSPLGVLALVCGVAIPFVTGWWSMGWVHGKATLGVLLIAYQHICRAHLRRFETKTCRHSHKWYRVFNEVPVLIMALALYLVVFKPF